MIETVEKGFEFPNAHPLVPSQPPGYQGGMTGTRTGSGIGLSSPVPSIMRPQNWVGGWREKRALKKSDSRSKKTIVLRHQRLMKVCFH